MSHAIQRKAGLHASVLNRRTAVHPINVSGKVICYDPRVLRLTEAQREVLVMLLEVPQPSCVEIARRLGISKPAVHDRILWMEKKGAVRRPHRSPVVDVLRPCAAWPDELVSDRGERLAAVWI